MSNKNEETWAYFQEVTKALFTIAKILTEQARDQKELYAAQQLDPHLAKLAYLSVRRTKDDPRPKVRKILRDENGKISGLEEMFYDDFRKEQR